MGGSGTQGTSAATTQSLKRLDRSNLLQFRDTAGQVRQGSDLSHWELRREEVLRGMQEVTGPLPEQGKRVPLDVKMQEEVDCGSYLRRLVTYTSEPGATTPAYLLVPKVALQGRVKLNAVLALHSTELELGHKVVVGMGKRENRDYANQLAEAGFVVIAPSYPQMAHYQPDLKALGYQSGTMKAIWDNIRALDLLDSLPYVKHGNFGAMGHSLGGHNAIYTAVFDERIKVVVSSCGFDSFLDYMGGDITGWTQERYMPRIGSYKLEEIPFDFYELVGVLAPRLLYVSAPRGDTNFQWQSVDRIAAAAKVIYRLYDSEKNLVVDHPECGHDLPDEVVEKAIHLMRDNLK